MFDSALRSQLATAMVELEKIRLLHEQERSLRQKAEATLSELRKQVDLAEERATRMEQAFVNATAAHSRTLEGVILHGAGVESSAPSRAPEPKEVKPPQSATTPFRRMQHKLIREAVKDLQHSHIKAITGTVQ